MPDLLPIEAGRIGQNSCRSFWIDFERVGHDFMPDLSTEV
jgi:hypothetical protein